MRLIDENAYQEKLAKIPMDERTFRKAVEVALDMPTVCDIEQIRQEIQKVMDSERDLSTENAKAQYIALGWCLDVIDKHTKVNT